MSLGSKEIAELWGGKPSLCDPKVVTIRSDKTAQEADTTAAIEQLYLRQRMS